MLELNKIHQGDCLEVMLQIPDKSIDMILCDLPYGTTACKWDTVIPFEPLWKQYKRIIKDRGAIVLTASQPFTTVLINSNIKNYRCCWYWEKSKAAAFALAKIQPLRVVEEVVVFSYGKPKYNPQMTKLENPYKRDFRGNKSKSETTFLSSQRKNIVEYTHLYPRNLLYGATDGDKRVHPTQKPVALFKYLVKTYTNEGDLVLDNCIGSGTTAIACINTKRNYIGIEKEPKYVKIAKKRIKEKEKENNELIHFQYKTKTSDG